MLEWRRKNNEVAWRLAEFGRDFPPTSLRDDRSLSHSRTVRIEPALTFWWSCHLYRDRQPPMPRKLTNTVAANFLMFSVIAFCVEACGADGPREDEVKVRVRATTSEGRGFQMPLPNTPPSPFYYDHLSRRWDLRSIVTEFATTSAAIANRPTTKPTDAELDAMSDYDLAEHLRPVVLHAGKYEYVLAEPDVARTHEARAMRQAHATARVQMLGQQNRVAIDAKGEPTPLLNESFAHLATTRVSENKTPVSDLLLPPAGKYTGNGTVAARPWFGTEAFATSNVGTNRLNLNNKRITSTDTDYPLTFFPGDENRSWVAASAIWASAEYTTAVAMRNTVNNDKCSARMIGPSTGASAAHCFYNRGNPGSWTNGFDSFKAGLIHEGPLGGISYSEALAYGPWACYSVLISGGYMNPLYGSELDDWALLDFNPSYCGNQRPGDYVGYAPVGISTSGNDYWWAASSIQGYDGEAPLPPYLTHNYYPQSLITRTRSAFHLWTVNSWLLAYDHDTTGGASGSGVCAQIFSSYGDWTPYFVGMHHGGDSSWNYARRMDWDLFYVLVGWISDW